jgi:hypothetical protein
MVWRMRCPNAEVEPHRALTARNRQLFAAAPLHQHSPIASQDYATSIGRIMTAEEVLERKTWLEAM